MTIVLLAGCAANQAKPGAEMSVRMKTIILDAPRGHWVNEISNRLQAHGFEVLRRNSGAGKSFKDEKARYAVVLHGHEFKDPAQPCAVGSFQFEIDIVDATTGKIAQSFFESSNLNGCSSREERVSSDLVSKISSALINLPD
jgi:lipoate-protein ligase A